MKCVRKLRVSRRAYLGHCGDGDSESECHLNNLGVVVFLVPAGDARGTADEDEEERANVFGHEHAPNVAILAELIAAEYVAHSRPKFH